MRSSDTYSEYERDQRGYSCLESALLLRAEAADQHSAVQAGCCPRSRLGRLQRDAASRRFRNERESEWYRSNGPDCRRKIGMMLNVEVQAFKVEMGINSGGS